MEDLAGETELRFPVPPALYVQAQSSPMSSETNQTTVLVIERC